MPFQGQWIDASFLGGCGGWWSLYPLRGLILPPGRLGEYERNLERDLEERSELGKRLAPQATYTTNKASVKVGCLDAGRLDVLSG